MSDENDELSAPHSAGYAPPKKNARHGILLACMVFTHYVASLVLAVTSLMLSDGAAAPGSPPETALHFLVYDATKVMTSPMIWIFTPWRVGCFGMLILLLVNSFGWGLVLTFLVGVYARWRVRGESRA